jgi:hypothetical protein
MPKKIFTNDQIQYVISNYKIKSADDLSKELCCKKCYIYDLWHKYHVKEGRRTYNLDENYFEKINTSEKAYFLGFIAADGCLYKKNKGQNIIKITIHIKDIKLLNKFSQSIKTNKPFAISRSKYCSLEIVSDKMFNDLLILGLAPNKTYGNSFVNLEDKYMSHFIRGYFDGDGSISSSKKDNLPSSTVISFSGYYDNMLKISKCLEQHYIFSNFNIDNRKYNGNSSFGNLGLHGINSRYSFIKYIYNDANDFYLDRKYKEAMAFIEKVEKDTKNNSKESILYYDKIVKESLQNAN